MGLNNNLQQTSDQIDNQLASTLGTFTSQAAPLQTDIIGKILPVGSSSWKGISPIETPDEIKQNQENMRNAYRDMRSSGLDSKTIGRNLANGMYEGGSNWLPKPSAETEASISGLTQLSEIIKPEMGPETRKGLRQENRQEKQEAQKEWQESAEGQAAINNIPSGTGNTFVDSFNAFSAIKDAPKFSDTGGGAKAFMSSKTGLAVSGAVNAAAGVVGSLANAGVGNYDDRPEAQQLNETQESVRSAIYSGVAAIPGYGPLISAGLQLTDGLGKMLGTQLSNISKDAAEDAGISRGFNNVVATIPGMGSVMGVFSRKTKEFEIDRDRLDGVGSAYDMSTFDSAEDLSGGLFLGSRGKINEFIAEQERKRDKMTGISDTQKARKAGASTAAADLAQQNRNRYSGLTGGQIAIGKKGVKLSLSWARGLLSKFQKGGKLGTPGIESNVIVEGAYHAHKNHLDEVNPELSDMTPKGIPVATEDASGNKTQVAEIEVGELILTKDLTDKLEELYKDGSDNAAIQAGMLFAEEIIDNTVDNKGGVLDGDN